MTGSGKWTILLALTAAAHLRAQQPFVVPTALEPFCHSLKGICEIAPHVDRESIGLRSLSLLDGELDGQLLDVSGAFRKSDWWGADFIPGWRPITLSHAFPDVYPGRFSENGDWAAPWPLETWTPKLFQCPAGECHFSQLIHDDVARHVIRLSDGSCLIVNDPNGKRSVFDDKSLLFVDDDNFSLPFQFGGPDTIKYPDGTDPVTPRQRLRTVLLQLFGLSMEFNF
jgi:hypothetical protein